MSIPAQAYDDTHLEEGDSRFDKSFPYQNGNLFFRHLNSHFLQAGPHGTGKTISFRRPVRVRKAINGSTTTTLEARLSAELALNPNLKYAEIGCGINDVHTSVDLTTIVVPKVTSIMAKLAAAGFLGGWWAGPECWGENGAFTAGCLAFDAAVSPIVQAVTGFVYLSMVSRVAQVVWPTFNPGNLVVGPLTTPDSAGAHPNPFGASKDAEIFRAQVTFA